MKVTISVIKALQNKQEDAFTIIYYKYARLVYCRILDIIKDRHKAEQLLNDTFQKVFEKAKYFQIKSNKDSEVEMCFYKWIICIARNLAINEYNRSKRERVLYNLDTETISNRYVDYQKLQEDLLPMLDEIELRIVVDHIYCNVTFRHIAYELNLTESVVNKMYHKAIKKIKNAQKSKNTL